MILQDYLRLLRRGWWLLVGVVLVGAAGGVAATLVATPVFYAQSTVLISVGGEASPSNLQQGTVFALQRAPTYAGLATTSTVLERAITDLGPGVEVDELQRTVTATARPESGLIDITAAGPTGVVAADTANAVASALAAQVGLVDAPGDASLVQLSVVESARPPTSPTTPRPRNNLLIGLAVGLAVGVALLVLRQAVDDRVRTGSDVPRSRKLDTPVTLLPRDRHLRAGDGATTPRDEAFRHLRATLQTDDRTTTTIAVAGITSAADVLGVVRGLAGALGEMGSAVVVVDFTGATKTRRGSSKTPVAITSGARASDQLLDPQTALAAIVPGEGRNVYGVAAADIDAAPGAVFGTRRGAQLLEELSKHFSYTLLVCQPVLESADTSVAVAQSDTSLLVARAGKTSRADCLRAFDTLAGVRASTVGVVVDDVRDADLRFS